MEGYEAKSVVVAVVFVIGMGIYSFTHSFVCLKSNFISSLAWSNASSPPEIEAKLAKIPQNCHFDIPFDL